MRPAGRAAEYGKRGGAGEATAAFGGHIERA